MIRICKYCGTEFETKHGKKIYCDHCKEEANRKKALERYYYKKDDNINDNVICSICGKEFIQDKYNRGKKPLCSKECKQENHKIQQKIRWETKYKNKRQEKNKLKLTPNTIKKKCIECNNEFNVDKHHNHAKFCSKNCYEKNKKRKYKKKENTIKKCKLCGQIIEFDNTKPFNTQIIRSFCCDKHREIYNYKIDSKDSKKKLLLN